MKEGKDKVIATINDVAFCKQFCKEYHNNCGNLMNEKKELVAPCNWTEIEPPNSDTVPDGCQTI